MAEPRREPPIRDYEIGITLSSRFETFSVVAIFVPLSCLSYMARPVLSPRTSMLLIRYFLFPEKMEWRYAAAVVSVVSCLSIRWL